MLKNKRLFIFKTIFVLLIVAYLSVLNIRNASTDNVRIIEQYLTEVFKVKQNIGILNTEVALNYEIVGFQYGNCYQFGFAVFKKEVSKYYLDKCYLQEKMAKSCKF